MGRSGVRTPDEARALARIALAAAHAGEDPSGTPRQANFVSSILSKAFNLAEAWDLRPKNSNPCWHVRRYPEVKRERFLSERELFRLGEALNEQEAEGKTTADVTNFTRLLALTGC